MNKICVYAICKNEEKFVNKWLESMSEADYIVVLDTGSTDNTYNLLKNDSRVTKVEQKEINPWRFDVARNESMKLIPEDTTIFVCTDLDEVLEPGWADILRSEWDEKKHKKAWYKYAWSHKEDGSPARVFYYDKIHSKGWKWKYPVHEMLVLEDEENNIIPGENVLNVFDKIYLHHYPDQEKSRGSYLKLLELRAKEYKEDWYGLIYLAHEYYYRDKYEKSIEVLNYIMNNYSDKYSSIEQASCYLFLGDNYRKLGKNIDAINSYNKAIEIEPTYREPYLNAAEAYIFLKEYESAILLVNQALSRTYRHYTWLERNDSWVEQPYDLLALSYYHLNKYDKAYENGVVAVMLNKDDSRLRNNLLYYEEKFNDITDDNKAISIIINEIKSLL